jgi:hypothetical protein
MMPRATVPDAVPLPTVDERALAEVMRADDARAARAKATRLPSDVLSLGTAIRALQAAQLKGEPEDQAHDLQKAHALIDEARRMLAGRTDWEDVLTLRAVQMSAFLDELARFEKTGQTTTDLDELGGGFVVRMRSSGWMNGNRFVLDEAQRRAMFKTVWNTLAGVLPRPAAGGGHRLMRQYWQWQLCEKRCGGHGELGAQIAIGRGGTWILGERGQQWIARGMMTAIVALAVIALALVQAALQGVYSAALYRYATDGNVGESFSSALLGEAFRRKG